MPSGTFPVSVTWPGGTAEIRWRTTDNPGANQSTVYVELWAHTSGFTTFGNGTFQMRIGNDVTVNAPGATIGGAWVKVAERSRTLTHAADGTMNVSIGVSSGYVSGTSWTAASGLQTVALTNYNRVPAAVAGRATDNITPTGFRGTWSQPSTPLPILEYQILIRRMSDGVETTHSTGTTRAYTASGRNPGTQYGWKVRARNADGWGAYSSTWALVNTLPAGAPSITPVSNIAGTAVTLTMAPPGGVTGVTAYNVQRRLAGTTSPVTSAETATTTLTMTGLTPGATYEYRANAEFGSYTTDWSSWVSLTQSNPNINPGNYFDGATPDTSDVAFSFTGTANNSTSIAQSLSVLSIATDYSVSGGTGVIQRILGGVAGEWAARHTMLTDATAAGLSFGTSAAETEWLSDVEEDEEYTGSIYVRPSRSQRLAAAIRWYDGSEVFISTSVGVAEVVAPGAFERLAVTATAPANAEWGVVRVVDVAGAGHSVWLGGEWLDIDAAMTNLGAETPYFDGDTEPREYEGSPVQFRWIGDDNESVSVMEPFDGGFPSGDPLIDPLCPPLPTPPTPPQIDNLCIDETGVWRRFWIDIPAEAVSRGLVTMPRLTVFTGSEMANQVRVRYYENPTDVQPGEISWGWDAEQIVSYIPAGTTFLLDSLFQRASAFIEDTNPNNPWANVWRDAGHLVYSTGGLPPTWPLLECGISYAISVDVPADSAEGNESFELNLVTRL